MTIRFLVPACAIVVAGLVAAIGGPLAAAEPPSSAATPSAAAAAQPPDMGQLADEALRELGGRLKLTGDQSGRIRPLLIEHMTAVHKLFADYTDASGASLPGLMQEFRERRERFKSNLKPILTPPQMQEVEVIRKEVDEALRGIICDERLAALKPRLSLTADQETRLRPILQEDFEKKRNLVAVMTVPTGGPAARKAPTSQFEAIQSATEGQMRKVLSPEQMAAYETYRNELRAQAGKAQ